MNKRWLHSDPVDAVHIDALAKKLNINSSISEILIHRGIDDFEKAKDFFRPSLDSLHDPFLMADMSQAVSRLKQAIQEDQHIMIYGDYDVDGTTSVALVMGYLRNHHSKLSYYINDRSDEGYGISEKGILWAAENEIKLIITLDCGIKAGEMVDLAAEKGIDFIICDHHNTGDILPSAVAVLDPKRKDCMYPYKELSGCGVGFKLMQGISIEMKWEMELLFQRLDLLAVSIAADIVPITGENRVLCYYGLQALNKNPLPGLKALLDLSNRGEININGIVFGIAPRINAAGRMAHANMAVDLLLTEDFDHATEMADEINSNNSIRRNFDSTITEEALEMIEGNDSLKSTVVFKEDWHLGVLGIVASRCIEHYHKPTIVLGGSKGAATGSARSVPGYNIYEAILECEDLLTKFGGHTHAAGLSLSLENIPKFKERFEEVVASSIPEELLIPPLNISTALDFDSISMNFVDILDQMEPFGPENPSPIFYSEGVYFVGNVDVLKEKHIKFVAGQKGSLKTFEAIGFGMSQFKSMLKKGEVFRMAYSVEKNYFMGQTRVQLKIRDIQECS